MADERGALRAVLEDARAVGFLGPGPVEPHLDQAYGFVAVVEAALGAAPSRYCDLGTGGGVPGLVLAVAWPSAGGVFVESNARRAEVLATALGRLGLAGRVQVLNERAEVVARDERFREQFAAVTARSFAEPAVTAEIAAGLVAVGGVVVVSDPPEPDPARWPAAELLALGFAPVTRPIAGGRHFAVLRKRETVAPAVPRGVGRPAKRPRW